MKSLLRTILPLTLGLMVAACSDKQKEDAAQLEQQLSELEQSQDTAAKADTSDAMAAEEIVEETPFEQPSMSYMPPRPSGAGYTVQVAGCESMDYAEHLVEVYSKRGYEPYISTITYNEQTYYRVRLGNFETMQPAKDLQTELADRFSITTWIDRIEK